MLDDTIVAPIVEILDSPIPTSYPHDAPSPPHHPPCNWTAAEREAGACDNALPLAVREATLRSEGFEYNEVPSSHLVSRPDERDDIWRMPQVSIVADDDEVVNQVVVTVDEAFAGGALLSRELRPHSASPNEPGIVFHHRGFIEKDAIDIPALREMFPEAKICEDFHDNSWKSWPPIKGRYSVLLGCPPCRVVAPSGKQLGPDDPDAHVTSDGLGDMAVVHGYDWAVGEQHEQLAIWNEGSMYSLHDASLNRARLARINRVPGAPCDAELASGCSRPTERGRLTFFHEKEGRDLGPLVRLHGLDAGGSIQDIIRNCPLEPDELAAVIMVGKLVPVSHSLPADGRIVVVAHLFWGEHDGVVQEGSQVHFRDGTAASKSDKRKFIVHKLYGTRAKLFYDSNRSPEYLRELHSVRDLVTSPRRFDCLHPLGRFGSLTRFGTPPLYGQKQLIMRDGQPSLFATDELYRLHGDVEHLYYLRGVKPALSDVEIRGQVGKSLVRDFASKIIDRLVNRIQLAVDVDEGRLQPHSQRPEHAALRHMRDAHTVGTALILVDMSAAPKVLVGRGEKLIAVDPTILTRNDAKSNSTALSKSILSECVGFDPDSFVAGTSFVGDHEILVTVCPIIIDTRYLFDDVDWKELHKLKHSFCSAVYHSAIQTCIANLHIAQGTIFSVPTTSCLPKTTLCLSAMPTFTTTLCPLNKPSFMTTLCPLNKPWQPFALWPKARHGNPLPSGRRRSWQHFAL